MAENKNIHILSVCTSDVSGGAARAAYRIHQSVRQLGVDSKMFVKNKGSQDPNVHSLAEFVPANILYRATDWCADKWNKIDWSLDYLDEFLTHPEQIEAFNRGGDDLTEMLCMQRDGKIDSWAIRYAFQHYYHHAVAILPCVPYVDNIGFDGTGIHSGTDETDFRNNVLNAPDNPRMPDVVYEDKRIINAFYNYYCRTKRPLWQKAINFICRQLGLKPPFVIKKKIYA